MKNKKTVLVLGGSGFIGKNIAEMLSPKYSLLIPTRSQLNLLDEGSVGKYLSKFKPDVVIFSVNLGGTRKDPSPLNMIEENLRMFFNVVKNERYFEKMIFLGSGAEYDKKKILKKVREDEFDKTIPTDSYGFYKYICSKHIESNNKIINLRIFGLFGKYEDFTLRFISNSICKVIYDLPITMNQNVYFDYVFIDDFIRIIDYFIEHPAKHKFYNIGSGHSISLLSLAKQINLISGKNKKIIIKKSGLGKEYSSDNTRLKKEISNLKFTPFKDSIKILIDYYTKNKTGINKDLLSNNYN